MLCTKMRSQLYKEAHAGNMAIIRSKGESLIHHAFFFRLEREASWTRIYSTVTHKKKTLWQKNIYNNIIIMSHEESRYKTKSLITTLTTHI